MGLDETYQIIIYEIPMNKKMIERERQLNPKYKYQTEY
jgi:hypothetical protein